jgi:hypothetical protein
MNEVWKDIEGYENLYQVSNFGEVKSLSRESWNGVAFFLKKEKILHKNLNTWGYPQVTLCKNNTQKIKRIHRLVLEAFAGKSNLICNHKDGNKKNNRLENLEYCTHSENSKHAFRIGLTKNNFPRRDQKGKNNPNAKLTDEDIILIRTLKGKTITQLANLFDVTIPQIRNILNNKTWTHI